MLNNPVPDPIEAARAAGSRAAATEPRAVHAEYDRERGVVMVKLRSGAWFGFPARLGEGLAGATDDELAAVELDPVGEGLHWDALDADISVPGIIFDTLNAPAWWARWIASRTSERKAAASRENGRKGGRPRTRPVR